MNSGARLILICGLPASGKTTLAKNLEAKLGAMRLCADDWMDALHVNLWNEEVRARIESLQWTLAQRLLELGNLVIIEWGSWARSERDALRECARALGAAVELRCLDAPVDLLMERLEGRRMEGPPITREQMIAWQNLFQPPTPEELALYDPPVVPVQLTDPHPAGDHECRGDADRIESK